MADEPTLDREALGKLVRSTWIKWAKEQPNSKPSWLLKWDELTEPDKDIDRRIGEAIWAEAMRAFSYDREDAFRGRPSYTALEARAQAAEADADRRKQVLEVVRTWAENVGGHRPPWYAQVCDVLDVVK